MSAAGLESRLTASQGLAYGLMGLPLAFVALPLYVVLPHYYASEFGVPLASLGFLLLTVRAADAVADPLIGLGVDRLLGQPWRTRMLAPLQAAAVLALAFQALFFPAVRSQSALLAWCGAALAVCYVAYSGLSVLHQAWGARLGGDASQRARIVSWREGAALVGVLTLVSVDGTGVRPGWRARGMLVASCAASVFFVLYAGGDWMKSPMRILAGLVTSRSGLSPTVS